ncbi:MAG: hypothetical protein Q8K51_08510 [Nitrospirota bacterium]|nr:hypothetical protein [Nitrospirota bacterium]
MPSPEWTLDSKIKNSRPSAPKIRQQLQILRDKGILKFKGKGRYRAV